MDDNASNVREISEQARELLAATYADPACALRLITAHPTNEERHALLAFESALRSQTRGEGALIEKWRADIQTCLDNLPAYAAEAGLSKDEIAGREYAYSYALAAMSDLQELATISEGM